MMTLGAGRGLPQQNMQEVMTTIYLDLEREYPELVPVMLEGVVYFWAYTFLRRRKIDSESTYVNRRI